MDIEKFTSYKINNISFYTNKQTGNHVLDTVMSTCPNDAFVVACVRQYTQKDGSPKVYSKYAQVTKEQLETLLQNDHQIFEVMHSDRRQKIGFDVDFKTKSKVDPLSQMEEKILQNYPDAVMNISGSKTLLPDKRTWKHSYHIILQNYIVETLDDLCDTKEWCTLPEQKALGFDPAIYRNKGLMKCVNQSKGEKDDKGKSVARIQKILKGSTDIFDHTLFHNIPDDAKVVTCVPTPKKRSAPSNTSPKKKRKLENVADVPKMNLEPPADFDIYTADPYQVLAAHPNFPRGHDFQLSNDICCKVARWCKTVGMTFENFWDWCKQKEDTPDRKQKYEGFWNRTNFQIKHGYLKGNLLQCYNKDILKSKAITQLSGMMNNHIDIPLNSQYLSKDILDDALDKSDSVVLDIPCGTGKTEAVIKFINAYRTLFPTKRILWVTCRIALTEEQRGRLGNEWYYYLDPEAKQKRTNVPQYFVCSVMSLFKWMQDDTNYDLVILDECETLLSSFGGEAKCHNGKSMINWSHLVRLVQTSKNIWMDAFLTSITLDTISAMDPNGTTCIIKKPTVPKTRKLILLEGLVGTGEDMRKTSDPFWKEVYRALDNGEKIFIATGSKGYKRPGSLNNRESVEAIVAHITNRYDFKRGKQLLAYHSDSKKEKRALKNINKVWGTQDLRVVIGNACLAVGVNFDPPKDYPHRPFDRVFGILDQCCMSPRDFMQLIQRIRHPINTDVIMYIKRGYSDAVVNKRDLALEAMIETNLHGMGNLARNLMTERRAALSSHIVKALKLFVDRSVFVLEIDSTVMCEEEFKLISGAINTENNVFLWKSIKSINEEEYEEIQNKMHDGVECDMDEILQFTKYRFRKLFVDTVEEKTLQDYWDLARTCVDAMDQVAKVRKFGEKAHVSQAAHVVNKMLTENNIDIFKDPYEIKKCSVPFAQIKNAFDFRNVPTTLRNDLYAKMFNAFFYETIYKKEGRNWEILRPSVEPEHLTNFVKKDFFADELKINSDLGIVKKPKVKRAPKPKPERVVQVSVPMEVDDIPFPEFRYLCITCGKELGSGIGDKCTNCNLRCVKVVTATA